MLVVAIEIKVSPSSWSLWSEKLTWECEMIQSLGRSLSTGEKEKESIQLRERVSVCVCVRERERERKSLSV